MRSRPTTDPSPGSRLPSRKPRISKTHPSVARGARLHRQAVDAHAPDQWRQRHPGPHRRSLSASTHWLAEGSLGEFDIRVLLSQYASKEEGEQAAAHLAGGSYALFEYKHDKTPLLAFASTWDSDDAAGNRSLDDRADSGSAQVATTAAGRRARDRRERRKEEGAMAA